KCCTLGILSLILMGPAMAVSAVTVIGIPVAILLPMAYVAALSLGMVSFGSSMAGMLSDRFLGGTRQPLALALIGILIFSTVWFAVAMLMGSSNSVAEGFGIALLVLAILMTAWPVCTGLGAVILTRFGFREYETYGEDIAKQARSAPAPPPIPKAPPVSPPPSGTQDSEKS
ncbi:MAG: hypothetical protein V3T31_01270, partial [candidate division Zixibacteria bacterium]